MEERILEIGGLAVRPGERVSGELPVAGGGEPLPMVLVRGRAQGPAVLVTAGIHCAEYVGIQAALELAAELCPEDLAGVVVLLPLVNRNGFEQRAMSVVHEDGRNLNRAFPGRPDGTLSQRLAWTVTQALFRRVDYYIDLHCGDGFENLTPYVYFPGKAAREVVERARDMALCVGVPYMVRSQVSSGGAYNHAASMGIPGVLLERGGMGRWSREEVEQDKRDVRNILRCLGVLGGKREDCPCTPEDVGAMIYENAQYTGLWYPEKRPGDRLRRGELLGTVRDYAGRELERFTARQDGILLCQAASLNVLAGGPAVAYSQLPQGERGRG